VCFGLPDLGGLTRLFGDWGEPRGVPGCVIKILDTSSRCLVSDKHLDMIGRFVLRGFRRPRYSIKKR
jgi:hypothetical protein